MTESWFSKVKTVLNSDVSTVFKDVSQVLTTDIGDLMNDRRAHAILNLIAKSPDNCELYASLAALYLEIDKQEKALHIYHEISMNLALASKYDQAISFVRRGLEIDSSHPGLLILKGDYAHRNNNTNGAIRSYRDAADSYVKEGNIETAVSLLQQILQLGSTSRRDRLHLASLLINLGRIGDAVTMLDPLIDELRKGTTAALPMLETALQLRFAISNSNLTVAEKYLQVLLVREKYPQALLIAEKMLNKYPEELIILRKQLMAFEKMKKRGQAVTVCKKIAHIYDAKGNIAKKKLYLAKVLQFDKRDVEALLQLGGEKTIQDYVNSAISETESDFKWIKKGDD